MPSVRMPGATRREFLIGSIGTGLFMACASPSEWLGAARDAAGASAYEPNLWLRIGADGRVLVNVKRAEMGQHVGTALARIVADELEAEWKDVEFVHVDSHPKWGDMVTGGSWSVHTSFEELSRAGAAGRIALVEAGASLLGAPVGECRARAGRVHHGSRSVGYGEIVAAGAAGRAFGQQELAALPIKSPSERRLIGSPGDAADIPAKTTGGARYGIDAKLPGMVYARPVLPPTRYGSKVMSVDDSAARSIPGYLETIELDDPSGICQGWLSVVAESFPAAIKAADALEVRWQPGPRANVDEAAIQAEGDRLVNAADPEGGALWVLEGDVDRAFARAERVLDATYRTSTVLHFQLEPVNALATEEDGHWHIHSGNQWQTLTLPVIAKALGVPQEKITLHQYYLGGGFGRRLYGDYQIPAALTSKALGRPVKMVFTRPDDARFDCPRSPTTQRVRAAIARDGSLTGWEHSAAAGWPLSTIGPGLLAEAVPGGGRTSGFVISGADHWYSIESQRVRAINNAVAQETFLPGWLRAVGPGFTGWAVEQHIDEVAHATGRDPVEFRLSLLDGAGRNAGAPGVTVGGAKRLAAVLERAAELAGWSARGSLPRDVGMGVAVAAGQERTMPTWCACIARARVDRATGRVEVERLTAVVDAGTIVHPDGALAQLEGSTLWGLSMALFEGTEFEEGQVAAKNLDRYTPLRMDEVPELQLELVRNDHVPSGLGEPGVIAVAPAIANAIFDAVGARVRDLPIRPAEVKRVLGA